MSTEKMTEWNITFILDKKSFMIVKFDVPLEDVDCCYRVPLVFEEGARSYIIEGGGIKHAFDDFIIMLAKVLSGELMLHESITQDLGYLANESIYGETVLFCEKIYDVDMWVGWRYNVFGVGGRESSNTWLYNDKEGHVILEITPSYPWVEDDEEKDPDYKSYKEWIKSYKSYVVKKIPKNVARKWLEQAQCFVQKIDENMVWERNEQK